MFEKLLALIPLLIAALEANTAAHLGKASATPAAEVKKTKEKPAPAAETPATPPAAPAGITKLDLTAIAQKILDAAAAKGMTGDQAGAARIKVVNTKHGFKSSTAEGQPQDKLAAYKADLEAVLAEVEKAEESAV